MTGTCRMGQELRDDARCGCCLLRGSRDHLALGHEEALRFDVQGPRPQQGATGQDLNDATTSRHETASGATCVPRCRAEVARRRADPRATSLRNAWRCLPTRDRLNSRSVSMGSQCIMMIAASAPGRSHLMIVYFRTIDEIDPRVPSQLTQRFYHSSRVITIFFLMGFS
jgi:hypothetical protein